MVSFIPSLDAGAADAELGRLINFDIDAQDFQSSIRSLDDRFKIYAATCPAPFIAPDLIVTPELRRQSELYLPMAEISRIFCRFYRHSLRYSPILSSTFFHKALSWADLFSVLPERFQFSVNPARLLESLLSDRSRFTEFLLASFMPRRFYGGFRRYPGQFEFIREWLCTRKYSGALRCLDAACGAGEDTYGLAQLLMEAGYAPAETALEGWTLEPLEVWAAAHRSFPHDRRREAIFRGETSGIFEQGYHHRIRFCGVDLTEIQAGIKGEFARFDLILCNGLLGGPIINDVKQMERVAANLSALLAPGGILLAADSFHGGWKSTSRSDDLKRLFLRAGVKSFKAGEGDGGAKLPVC